jgi:hypothetical protein
MNEKEIKEISEDIVEAIVALSLGREPNFISGKIFKTISKHPQYENMKKLYIDFLMNFDGKFESTEEIKKLSDFRFALVQLYQQ